MNGKLLRAAWVLGALLAISMALLALGKADEGTPTARSFSASGTSALVELLQKSGYSVRVDRRSRPVFEKDEVAVAFYKASDEEDDDEEPKDKDPISASLLNYGLTGGRVLFISFPSQFGTASRKLGTTTSELGPIGTSTKPLRITSMVEEVNGMGSLIERLEVTADLWKLNGLAFLTASTLADGTVFLLQDGLPLSNRYLDKADNAEMALELFQRVSPSKKLVFTEASFGLAEDPGLLGAIGDWAVAAWWQLVLTVVVVICTLGRRFGLPTQSLPSQSGTRQLLDALADTQYRGRHTHTALRATIQVVEHDIRSVMRLPKDADLRPFLAALPEPLRLALAEARSALTEPQLRPADALIRIRAIQKAKEVVGKLDRSMFYGQ